ncbi:Holliday junction branch migration protein RuvA [Coxiella burnetii]|uniref:Holliday junction branch migration complex subunit RuvA n=3 Tax=Coxiella burnetii TaxID=777 RepID=RUVA_COXBU|nr:Holliday junction branch migration protein RuvA [Coxiella burnetii]NP_820551.1 holliday junction DNA helicase [Coxiella burnetii RSA 493]A9N9A2.1 RecName: Full=Holliday junction branch migration complex subunit RuvA [Coxiella burnetii RSA 331]B6J505.1 RecName: Full=Holliday junction branch migration complex subunit RuvA [Coxiella burnetii CbuK_Q154]Q83BE2.1 RecName: Full=Holliday junction branch migration complex subunit RuvA [Coxiella burnetii RSA 493]AAO91065.1 holliday junction DNA helic
MIGHLRGIIVEKQPPYLLLEVAGVGYEITAPLSTFYHLPEPQEEILLYTHLIVREDAHTLYGFHNDHERRLFRALIKVNGVGPKLALAILSGIGPDEFVHCVLNQNIDQLVRIPGVGRKTAERLVIETKDGLSRWHTNDTPSPEGLRSSNTQPTQDAISALMALGYKPQEAKRAIDAIQKPDLSAETLIRLALKQMVLGT